MLYMSNHLYKNWCDVKTITFSTGRTLHLLAEKSGARVHIHAELVETVHSHYEDPSHLADRIKRRGFKKAAKVFDAILPRTKKARSGHLGEILAAEVIPAILPSFQIPIKRLRWLDGRESALRGEDLIGIALSGSHVYFLKGESKSRQSITPSVISKARQALKANRGRPSQHALGFVMHRLTELGNLKLALVFEDFMLKKTIPSSDLVHLLFTLTGNDASVLLQDDLKAYTGKVDQHSVNFHVPDHQNFISSVYK